MTLLSNHAVSHVRHSICVEHRQRFFFFIFLVNSLNILCTPSCLFFLVMTERIELSNCCDPRAKGRGKSFCNKLRRSTVRQKADHNPLIDFRFR